MENKNIGGFARKVIRQVLGGEKGQSVIDAIEKGYLPALTALVQGNFGLFINLLPEDAKDGLLKAALKKAGPMGAVIGEVI